MVDISAQLDPKGPQVYFCNVLGTDKKFDDAIDAVYFNPKTKKAQILYGKTLPDGSQDFIKDRKFDYSKIEKPEDVKKAFEKDFESLIDLDGDNKADRIFLSACNFDGSPILAYETSKENSEKLKNEKINISPVIPGMKIIDLNGDGLSDDVWERDKKFYAAIHAADLEINEDRPSNESSAKPPAKP